MKQYQAVSLFLAIALLGAARCQAVDIFVSPRGSDNADGSRARPFATLEQARDAIRHAKATDRYPSTGLVVQLAPGDYRRGAPFELGAEDSGKAGAPIIYRGAPGGVTRILGGRSFSLSEFAPVQDSAIRERLPREARDQVRQLDLKAHAINQYAPPPLYGSAVGLMAKFYKNAADRTKAVELFLDGEPMTLARWPNQEYARVAEVVEPGDVPRDWMPDRKGSPRYVPDNERPNPPHGFAIRENRERVCRWATAPDALLYGYWKLNWSDQSVDIAWFDAEQGIIRSRQPALYGVQKGQRFYIYHLLEELDAPGEWYLDRKSGILYIHPGPAGPEARVEISILDEPLIRVCGAAHLRIEDFHFELGRGKGIVVEDSRDIGLTNLHVANFRQNGIQVTGGQDNLVAGCEIRNTGMGGVSLAGGNLKTLTPANHEAVNNLIHDYGRIVQTYQPGIRLSGVGLRAAHNEIHSAPHAAILFSGNNHIIECNHLHHVVRESDDAAAIYAGRSWTSRGTVIRHNLLRELRGYQHGTHRVSGIYLDDGISETVIEGNIFLDVAQGVLINGGRDNRIENNVFIDVENAMRGTDLSEAYKGWAFSSWVTLNEGLEAVSFRQPPWSEAYPGLARLPDDDPQFPKNNTVIHNLRHAAPLRFGKDGLQDRFIELGRIEDNSEISNPPGAFNPATGGFRFHLASGVFDRIPALSSIPCESIGRNSPQGHEIPKDDRHEN
jgi:parallel beta-helix repeat protein